MTEHTPRAAEHVNNISHGCFGNTILKEIQQLVYTMSIYLIMNKMVFLATQYYVKL